MNITKEQLESRRDRLKAEYEQLQRNLCAYEGAIQDCEHWLAVLESREPTEAVED